LPGIKKLFPAYIIDLDGTVYLGNRLLPTTRETISKLRSLDCKIVFITNEASKTRAVIAKNLTEMGIPTQPEDIINSSMVTAACLQEHYPKAVLYVIGEPSLSLELQEAGCRISQDPQQIGLVVISSDHGFNYDKLKIAFDAIQHGASIIATNADRTCPLVDGGEEPDALPIIAAIETSTGHALDVLVGKPSTYMAEAALRVVGVQADQCLLVGDNPETDIKMGNQAGMVTAWVSTGIRNNNKDITPTLQPDYQINQLADLIPDFVE
jgi:arabinose operon protein AraL